MPNSRYRSTSVYLVGGKKCLHIFYKCIQTQKPLYYQMVCFKKTDELF